MHAADTFVFLDDVNFIKKGFINRNSILLNRQAHQLSLPVNKISQNKRINEHTVRNDDTSILTTLKHAYARAPYYENVAPLLANMISYKEANLSYYLAHQLQSICEYLGIKCRFLFSSRLDKDPSVKGQDKIIALCKNLQTSHYINANGGKHLYEPQAFAQANIQLNFINPLMPKYQQYGNTFVNNLSIIDAMMFNSKEELSALAGQYLIE